MTALRLIRKIGEDIEYPKITEDIKDVDFDEMWHFVKKSQKELYSAFVEKGIFKHSGSCMKDSCI